jgi:branched-chain amino acid transport system permease protein
MEVFLQQLINGLTLGSIYGLIAIGYTMVFGIIGMVNFAHGDVFMIGSFIALITFMVLTAWLGLAVIPAQLLVLIIGMALTGSGTGRSSAWPTARCAAPSVSRR